MDENPKPDIENTEAPSIVPDLSPPPPPTPDTSVISESPTPDITNVEAPHPVDQEAPKPVISPPPKNGKKKLFIWLLIVILVAAGAFLGYKYFKNHKSQTTVNATEKAVQDVALVRYGTFEGVMNHFAPQQDSDNVTLLVNKQIFEPLVDFREKTKLTPVLAASWTNPDDTTWVFTLQPNVKFHNGDTLTAKDVVYSYNEMKKNDSFAEQVTGTIKNVEAVGDNQVKITTNGVDPILLNRLSGLYIIDSNAVGKSDPQYGTGPYTLKEGTTPDANHIDLTAFDNWHGGHAYTRELQVTVYNDDSKSPQQLEQQASADMKAGKLDIVGFVANDTANAAKAAGLNVVPIDDNSVYYIIPNTNMKNSPLANAKVRQAINMAIDPAALMKAIGRTGTAESQLVQQFIPGYNSAVTRPKYDVAAAKQLLQDAGYPNGTGFTLTVFVSAEDAGKEIARQLALAGIAVKLDIKNDVTALQNGVNTGSFEAFYYADGSLYNDARDVFTNELQSAYYKNPQIDKLLSESDSTLDQAKRLSDLQQVSKLAMDDTAVVPLYSNIPQWVTKQSYVLPQDLLSTDLGVLFYKVHLNQ